MNQHDFHDLFQSQQLLSLNSKIAALQSATHAAEARRAQEKNAKDRVFAAFEEFQLIQKNLHKFPLWAALRLIALHHDLQGHLPYSALAPLKPHVATDDGLFPFPTVTYGPLEQTDLEALEYKALLSKLKTGMPTALDEALNSHPEVKSETLTGVIECFGAAHVACYEADSFSPENEQLHGSMFKDAVVPAFLCAIILLMFGLAIPEKALSKLISCASALLVAGALFHLAEKRLLRRRAEAKKSYDSLIATAANKMKDAVAIVKGGPPTPPPQSQLPAPTVAASPPPAQTPKPRRTEPTALCSNCQQKIVFPIAMAGQMVSCPSCGAQTSLDDASDALD